MEKTKLKISVDDINGYNGKLFEDMNKEELIVIVKQIGSLLNEVKKMNDDFGKQICELKSITDEIGGFIKKMNG